MRLRFHPSFLPVFFAFAVIVTTIPHSHPHAQETLNCDADDPLNNTIYGACPKKPVQRLSTVCQPIIGKMSDALFVPIMHPDDPTVPYQCKSVAGEFNIGLGNANSAYCGQREQGDDDTDTGKLNGRVNACPKIFDKGKDPCKWHLEYSMCGASCVLAASANPTTVGMPKMPLGTADLLCEKLEKVVPHSPRPYSDPQITSAVVWDFDPYDPANEPSMLAKLFGINSANAQLSFGFKPPKLINSAGGFLQQVSRQFQPSTAGIPGFSGDASKFLGSMLDSFYGGGGFQIRSKDLTDILGNRIGDPKIGSRFQTVTGFAKKHVYDRDFKTGYRIFAAMQTEPYGTYDPSKFKPGQELKMALDLYEKTPEEIMQAKRSGNPLVKSAYAFVPAGSMGDLMKRVLPFSHQFGTNDKVLRYFTGSEMSLASYGLGQFKGLKLQDAFPKPLQQFIQPAMDVGDLKLTPYAQVMDPTSLFSPFEKVRKFPLNDHYSSCTSNQACKVTEDYIPYSIGAAYHNNKLDAVRASGTLQKVIRTNITTGRYRETNAHMLHRITYNRLCRAEQVGIYKPCHPLIPCWSMKCWGVPISAETPPCATRHDPLHDVGFPRFCYGPLVKMALKSWMLSTGAKVDLGVKPKRADDVMHQTAKCMPLINKINTVDVVQMANAGMTGREGAVFRQFFGNDRPYACKDETGKEHGQSIGGRPNYFSDIGANIALSYGQQMQDYVKLASKQSVPELAIKDDGSFGIVSSANAAMPTANSGGGAGPCYGGLGGACPGDKISPHASMTEVMRSQCRTAQMFGLNCIPKVERTYSGLMPEQMFLKALGPTVERLIDRGDGDYGVRSLPLPLMFRGFMASSNAAERFPYGGGCPANVETGLNSLVAMGEQAGGAIIMLPDGGVLPGSKPSCPNLALVQYVGKDTVGKYIDVGMSNLGTGPDSACLTQGIGNLSTHRLRENKLSPHAETAYNKIKAGGPASITPSIEWGFSEAIVGSWGAKEWIHFGKEENQCK